MRIEQLNPQIHFLTGIQPEFPREAALDFLLEWLPAHRGEFANAFDNQGAVLFRGFAITTAEEYAAVLEAAGLQRRRYIAGNNPRTSVAENVYLSTTYPPSWRITLHSEMSHLQKWPQFISLFCKVPPQKGGETPLALTQEIIERVPERVLKKLNDKKVTYVQRMSANKETFTFGRTWKEVFETENPQLVEKFCGDNQIQFRWEGSVLVSEFTRPATAVHPRLGKEVWFNQAEQWHYSNIELETRKFLEKKVGLGNFPHHSRYGDGEEFDVADLEAIRGAYDQSSHRFGWQRGDVLVFDNLRLAHGRDTYSGPREVFFIMGDRAS